MTTADPELANKALRNVRFLKPAHMAAYRDLTIRTQGLVRDEQITVPPYQEADAWSKLYQQYCFLKERRRAEDTPESQLAAAQAAASSLEWHDYLTKRAELQKTPYTAEEAEYCGLLPDDLVDPTVDGPDGMPVPRPGWQGRHSRITSALWRLRNMSHLERGNIGNTLATRRQEARIKALEEEASTLREFCKYFENRLSEIESHRANKH